VRGRNGQCAPKSGPLSRYRNYCNGKNSRSTSRKIRICIVVDMLQRKLADNEIAEEEAENDLQQYIGDLGDLEI